MKINMLFFAFILFTSCQNNKTKEQMNTKTYAFRLKPGEDLKAGIEKIVKENNITAGWIATCVGSLTRYQIRFANEANAFTKSGHFEIVSLVGTLSTNGSHLHISVSDSTGATIGGHLMKGCIVYTTAEIVIQASHNFIFKREKDGTTNWEELQVENLN
jgi:uncharacterized protein